MKDMSGKAKLLVEALCERCDTGFPCSLCKLHQFIEGMDKIAEGGDLQKIVADIKHLEFETLREKNKAYDAKYGFAGDVKI